LVNRLREAEKESSLELTPHTFATRIVGFKP
jgi:hypothetical protein